MTQLSIVEITGTLARRAGQLAEERDLRRYDAVHLAGAEAVNDPDTLLVAGDEGLCNAALSIGINVARI
ncbi:MAG TPA: hypothetical protein VIL12_06025 [Acidimicrobiia bacterium]